MHFTRHELSAMLAARHGQFEGEGEGAFIDLHVRVTPDLLAQMLGGHWVSVDGTRARLDGVSIDSDGLAYPILTREEAQTAV